MNWLNVSIIIIVFGGASLGLRLGLRRAKVIGLGIIIWLLLFGPVTDGVATNQAQYVPNETLIALLSYIVIIVV